MQNGGLQHHTKRPQIYARLAKSCSSIAHPAKSAQQDSKQFKRLKAFEVEERIQTADRLFRRLSAHQCSTGDQSQADQSNYHCPCRPTPVRSAKRRTTTPYQETSNLREACQKLQQYGAPGQECSTGQQTVQKAESILSRGANPNCRQTVSPFVGSSVQYR